MRRPTLEPRQALEWFIGLAVVALLLLTPGPRIVVRVLATVIGDAAASFAALMSVDGPATLRSVAVASIRMSIPLVPAVLLIRAVPHRRRLWLIPVVAMIVLVSGPLSLTACATPGRWGILIAASAAAAAATRVPGLRWLALLPFLVLWEILPTHDVTRLGRPGLEDRGYREELLEQCRDRDGSLPANIDADHLLPYHGINRAADGSYFLSGLGPNDGGMRGRSGDRTVGSWWLRRSDEGFEFDLPSQATGNLWQGCNVGGTLWMVRANRLVGVRRIDDGGGSHEEVVQTLISSNDMDFSGDTACDPTRQRVYAVEATLGGMWEFGADGQELQRHEIGGILPLPKRRFDGRLVITDTASLTVFDPELTRVTERKAAGLAIFGFDLCASDGTAAVADLAGRLRVFNLTGDGYQFDWGITLFAPRRVAYSPDCSRIAVTSADDRRVYIIDARQRSVVSTHRAGPALRAVVATGPREFSVADVCSITTYRW